MGNREKGIVKHARIGILRKAPLLAALILFAFPVTLFPYSPVYLSGSAVVSTATREGRLAVFDDAWATINERYYDPGFHGLDWAAQRTVFRRLAAEAGSAQELYTVLRRMIAPLNDPHTRVFAPEEKFDWWRPRFVSIGLAVREIGGLPTVVQVEPDSAPQRAGVRAGDVIEAVNGEPAQALVSSRLANSLASQSGPSLSSRARVFAKLLDGPPESSVEIRWEGKDRKDRSAKFRRHWEQRDLGLQVRRRRGYAVIEIETFTRQISSDFTRVMKEKLAGVRGFILDLRNNGGGDAEAMTDVASAFLGEGVDLGRFTDRSGISFTIHTRLKSLFMPERIVQTKLPLIVLISDRTSSAAEIFVAALRASRRASVIGAETCGCVLAIRTRHELPDGGVLDVSELDYQTSSGEHLESHSIKPDETVVIDRSDLYSGRDRALDLAVRRFSH